MAFQNLLSRLPGAPEKPKLYLKACPITLKSAKSWPTLPCSLWFEANAEAQVICVNCRFKEKRD
jgi:hypothetical protein